MCCSSILSLSEDFSGLQLSDFDSVDSMVVPLLISESTLHAILLSVVISEETPILQ